MEKAFLEYAYIDKAFPIGADQTISQPYTVAFQTELLDVQKGMKVLEIGSGSGYETSVLSKMGCKVYSIERHQVLHKKAQKLLQELGLKANIFFGDGFKGLPAYSPFDRVLVTCGADHLPQELIRQLKPHGKMVVPIGNGNEQVMTLILKNEDNSFESSEHGVFRFVPMLKDKAR
jgi:protein-L-isoaspartate(D-aspartate) O-methyltransferase